MCPRCKSTKIFKGRLVTVKDNDELMCESCNYSQKAKIFINTWKIKKEIKK